MTRTQKSVTSRITCHVGILDRGLELPDDPWTLAGRTIQDYFREGSSHRGGPPGIDLVIDESRRDSVRRSSGGPATQHALHEALKRLARNRGPGPRFCVRRFRASWRANCVAGPLESRRIESRRLSSMTRSMPGGPPR